MSIAGGGERQKLNLLSHLLLKVLSETHLKRLNKELIIALF
jgi:hypothetical protein